MVNSKTDFIELGFSYHEPDEDAIRKHQAIRDSFRTLAHFVDGMIPAGREKDLVLQKLQEAMHFANQAVAITQPIKVTPHDNVDLNKG